MQINSNIESQNETIAYSMYGEQLRLGLNYPKLAIADSKEISVRPEEYQQYMYHLLYACEKIFAISESDQAWMATIQELMSPHIAHLARVLPDDQTLEPSFRAFLQRIVEDHRHKTGVTSRGVTKPSMTQPIARTTP